MEDRSMKDGIIHHQKKYLKMEFGRCEDGHPKQDNNEL